MVGCPVVRVGKRKNQGLGAATNVNRVKGNRSKFAADRVNSKKLRVMGDKNVVAIQISIDSGSTDWCSTIVITCPKLPSIEC